MVLYFIFGLFLPPNRFYNFPLFGLVGISIFELLGEILESVKQELGSPFLAALTNDVHVLPDFHGNR